MWPCGVSAAEGAEAAWHALSEEAFMSESNSSTVVYPNSCFAGILADSDGRRACAPGAPMEDREARVARLCRTSEALCRTTLIACILPQANTASRQATAVPTAVL